MNIFPEIILSKTELDIVGDALSTPAVKKYFHMLSYNIGRTIATSRRDSTMTSEEYLEALAALKGQLETLNTLLEVEASPK